MERYTSFILKHRKMIIVVFVFLAVVCAGLFIKVGVNYKFADYLPDDAASTVALDTMEKEYSQPVPNMRVVIHDVMIPQALDYKKKLEQVDGVDEVNWLDDVVDIYEPLENADQDTIDDEIDEMLSKISGSDYTPVSFVSADNKDIGLVQFAIRTDDIKK